MKEAEAKALALRKEFMAISRRSLTSARPALQTKYEADHRALAKHGPLMELINSPAADMFTVGEPDQSKLAPVFHRRSFVDDICFGGATFDECLETLDRLLARFAECRISVSFTKSVFVQHKVDFLSHEVTNDGIRANSKKLAAIAELPFPSSKKGMQSFLGAPIITGASYKAWLGTRGAFTALRRKVAEAPILRHFDGSKDVYIMLYANEWALSSTLMQMQDEVLHPVRFCGRVLKENDLNYHPAEKEVLALIQVLKVCYTLLAGKTLHVYTRFSTLEWVFQSKSLFGRLVQFALFRSQWHLKIKRVRERDIEFAKLLQSSITPFVSLDDATAPLAPPSKGSATVRTTPHLFYASITRSYDGYVLSFDGSAKTENHGGHGSCSWILWKLPAWGIVIAASAHLPSTTVNIAEYTGMKNGVRSAIEHGVTDLIIVGDSRLAIQQSMGVIECRKETLQLKLSQHKELTAQLKSTRHLHVVRAYNAAADSLATEALESQVTKVVLSDSRKTELKALNKIPEVLYVDEQALAETDLPAQRMQPIPQTETHTVSQTVEEPQVTAVARNQSRRVSFTESTRHRPTSQEAVNEVDDLPSDQESPISPQGGAQRAAREGTGNLETNLDEPVRADPKEEERTQQQSRQNESGDFKRAATASKLADRFVLDEDGLLQYVGKGRKLDEVGEHEPQLRQVIPTTMIDEVLQSCHDSIEGGHQGITRTFHRVKKDYYWVGLYATVTRHVRACADCSTSKGKPHLKGYSPGNVLAERPFQLLSMDFVTPLPKPRRGDTSLLLFQCSFTGYVIAKAMSSTKAQDAAEANGQQERSVKSIVQTVNVYVEAPLLQDWHDIAEKTAHAINNAMDTTRKETPFYLVHRWDPQSTLKAITSSLRLGDGSLTDATAWRREANRQHEVALAMAKPYQATEKAQRAKEHNEA
ncbi:unnamed protein product [Phytophthora fragariaefolia]|uniref:Unnamed protein product n=1 Tax=Phytophthora fragariaefolia TaxID=1490495 RepID=A0A9W6TLJ4_9STRA|nr:unnamed protein product [Phytophthora fragariaefolia]